MFHSNQSEIFTYPCIRKSYTRKKPYVYTPPPKPYTRQFTVSFVYRPERFEAIRIPYIRICGKWLEDVGFSVGNKIKATVRDDMLILEAVKK